MSLQALFNYQQNRVFIVPLDHPFGDDTKQLAAVGVQKFIQRIDHLFQDGYIFQAEKYLTKPYRTTKDFFLTVGEAPDNYLCDPAKFVSDERVKYLTIFFEVAGARDEQVYDFFADYIKQIRKFKKDYKIMAMGFPSAGVKCDYYQHIADLAYRLGVDAFKTDWHHGIEDLDLHGMKLFIGGGEFIENEKRFDQFVQTVAAFPPASFSFGRNIFEAKKPEQRIAKICQAIA